MRGAECLWFSNQGTINFENRQRQKYNVIQMSTEGQSELRKEKGGQRN